MLEEAPVAGPPPPSDGSSSVPPSLPSSGQASPLLLRTPPDVPLGIDIDMIVPLVSYVQPWSILRDYVRIGDVLVFVNGRSTAGMSHGALTRLLSGGAAGAAADGMPRGENDADGEGSKLVFLPGSHGRQLASESGGDAGSAADGGIRAIGNGTVRGPERSDGDTGEEEETSPAAAHRRGGAPRDQRKANGAARATSPGATDTTASGSSGAGEGPSRDRGAGGRSEDDGRNSAAVVEGHGGNAPCSQEGNEGGADTPLSVSAGSASTVESAQRTGTAEPTQNGEKRHDAETPARQGGRVPTAEERTLLPDRELSRQGSGGSAPTTERRSSSRSGPAAEQPRLRSALQADARDDGHPDDDPAAAAAEGRIQQNENNAKAAAAVSSPPPIFRN